MILRQTLRPAPVALELTVPDERKRAQFGKWLESVAHTLEDVEQRARRANEQAAHYRLYTLATVSTSDAN